MNPEGVVEGWPQGNRGTVILNLLRDRGRQPRWLAELHAHRQNSALNGADAFLRVGRAAATYDLLRPDFLREEQRRSGYIGSARHLASSPRLKFFMTMWSTALA
jgi:hypothetical protein